MNRFTQLFLSLDRTNKTNEKVEALKAYFLSAPDEDKMWALALFTGRRPPHRIKAGQMQQWAMEKAGIGEWLFRESYASVGDLGETISLILPPATNPSSGKSLSQWFDLFSELGSLGDEEKRKFILDAWDELDSFETFVFN